MNDGENEEPKEEDLYSVAMEGRVEDIPRVLREHGGLRSSSLKLESLGVAVTPLHVAADGATVRALLAVGADPHGGVQGWTPLHQAAHDGRLEAARALLDAGAKVKRVRKGTEEQPLHRAALGGHADLIRLLVERGADVAAQARLGARPLHYASTPEATEALLRAGADPSARDVLGATALDLALQRGDAGSVRLLEDAGCPRGTHPFRYEPERAQVGLMRMDIGYETSYEHDILPAIVIGHTAPTLEPYLAGDCRGLEGVLPHPNWFVEMSLRVGGTPPREVGVMGLMLRLEQNAAQALQAPARLLRGLRRFHTGLQEEFSLLEPSMKTGGQELTREALSLLHQEVSACYRLPAFDWGLESFVRLEETDLVRTFAGWRVVGHRPIPEGPIEEGARWFYEPDQSRRAEDVTLTPEVLSTLQACCERFLGRTLPPPRAWLVWENSR
ncbi:ankyrin repeat domain-containing protein [Archangium gephyra]|uniref:ankyrin repeat domain-containing protein n=1 Tax=Archangium gephyra TaxID=48 RepID=UPI0035D499DE